MKDESRNDDEEQREQHLDADRGISGAGEAYQQDQRTHTASDADNTHKGQAQSYRTRWKKTTVSNQFITVATIVIATATIATCVTSVLQWRVLSRQLSQMEEGAEQTDRMIRETNRIANGMDSVRQQSKAALDASIEISRTDQRAWLSVYVTSETPRIGHNLTIITHVKNTGRSFAKDTKLCSLPADTETLRQIPQFIECTEDQWQFGTLMAPNDEWVHNTWYGHPSASRTAGLTATQVKLLNANEVVMWQYGKVTYSDIFGHDHWVKFCSRGIVRDGVLQFFRCPIGNEMDDG